MVQFDMNVNRRCEIRFLMGAVFRLAPYIAYALQFYEIAAPVFLKSQTLYNALVFWSLSNQRYSFHRK